MRVILEFWTLALQHGASPTARGELLNMLIDRHVDLAAAVASRNPHLCGMGQNGRQRAEVFFSRKRALALPTHVTGDPKIGGPLPGHPSIRSPGGLQRNPTGALGDLLCGRRTRPATFPNKLVVLHSASRLRMLCWQLQRPVDGSLGSATLSRVEARLISENG